MKLSVSFQGENYRISYKQIITMCAGGENNGNTSLPTAADRNLFLMKFDKNVSFFKREASHQSYTYRLLYCSQGT